MSEYIHTAPKGFPKPQGLYDSRHEHDACGIGFIANIKNKKSHDIVEQGLQLLINLTHRGAVGADPKAGDGAAANGRGVSLMRFHPRALAASGLSRERSIFHESLR